jgi:hypothetical protein
LHEAEPAHGRGLKALEDDKLKKLLAPTTRCSRRSLQKMLTKSFDTSARLVIKQRRLQVLEDVNSKDDSF